MVVRLQAQTWALLPGPAWAAAEVGQTPHSPKSRRGGECYCVGLYPLASNVTSGLPEWSRAIKR